jgi:hypothetical protein
MNKLMKAWRAKSSTTLLLFLLNQPAEWRVKSGTKTETLILQRIHQKFLSENPKKIFKNYCFCQTPLKREFTVRALSTLWDKLAKVL